MSFIDRAQKMGLISAATASSVKDVASLIGDVWPIGSAVLGLLSGGGDAVGKRLDAIERALAIIHRELQELKQEVVDQSRLSVELDRRRDVERELGAARLAKDLLLEFASPDEAESRPDPQLIKNESLRAIETISDANGAYWLGVYDPAFAFRFGCDSHFTPFFSEQPSAFGCLAYAYPRRWTFENGWPDPPCELLPANTSGDVWDYRYVLPAYLEALAVRIMVLSALEPNYRSSKVFTEQIRRQALNLRAIFDRICGAIQGRARIPEIDGFVRRILLASYPDPHGAWSLALDAWVSPVPLEVEGCCGMSECFAWAGEPHSGIGECLETIPPIPDTQTLSQLLEGYKLAEGSGPWEDQDIREEARLRVLLWVLENGVYGSFKARSRLLAETLWRRVYRRVGLDSLREIIRHLWRASNVIEGSSPDCTLPDPMAWSVRGTFEAISQELGYLPPGTPFVLSSLRLQAVVAAVGMKLELGETISLRQVFLIDLNAFIAQSGTFMANS